MNIDMRDRIARNHAMFFGWHRFLNNPPINEFEPAVAIVRLRDEPLKVCDCVEFFLLSQRCYSV